MGGVRGEGLVGSGKLICMGTNAHFLRVIPGLLIQRCNKNKLNYESYASDNSIISRLDEKTKQDITESFLTGSTNDGSTSSYITEPITFYKNYWAICNTTVTSLATNENIILNVPELNQSNLPFITENYSNDCANVATIEIMSYYYPGLTNAQKKTAYTAMINSTYFKKPDNGVMFNDNDQLFKVAVESLNLGKQEISDDEENYIYQMVMVILEKSL
jgi:hypothetical protein